MLETTTSEVPAPAVPGSLAEPTWLLPTPPPRVGQPAYALAVREWPFAGGAGRPGGAV